VEERGELRPDFLVLFRKEEHPIIYRLVIHKYPKTFESLKVRSFKCLRIRVTSDLEEKWGLK